VYLHFMQFSVTTNVIVVEPRNKNLR
jgi:hypothetical protein